MAQVQEEVSLAQEPPAQRKGDSTTSTELTSTNVDSSGSDEFHDAVDVQGDNAEGDQADIDTNMSNDTPSKPDEPEREQIDSVEESTIVSRGDSEGVTSEAGESDGDGEGVRREAGESDEEIISESDEEQIPRR